jgi:uncharacterized protein
LIWKNSARSALHFFAETRALLLALGFLACSNWAPLHAEKITDIHPQGYVTDLAEVVEPETQQRLEALGKELQDKTGAQIAIVTVRSLEGMRREEYAVGLFKHLGVGGKNDDRGVLLLLAPQERQYRIEVGYGLEPVINDARAGDIGRAMVPYLRKNDYSVAVDLAARQIAQLIAADRGVKLETNPRPVASPDAGTGSSSLPSWAPLLIIIGIFILLRALSGASRGRRRRGPSFWWIGPMGGGGWGGGGFGGSSGGWGGGGGFGGFGGGSSGGGGAGGSW